MVLALVIGDAYIPYKSPTIPTKFKQLLVPGKIQYTFFTGNLCCVETEEFLQSLGSELFITLGELDEKNHPERIITSVDSVSVGMLHGHYIVPKNDPSTLGYLRRDMGVDILLCGNTNNANIIEDPDGGLIIQPGSVTGVGHFGTRSPAIPSFVILDIQGLKITAFSYYLVNNEVKVERSSYDRVPNQALMRSGRG